MWLGSRHLAASGGSAARPSGEAGASRARPRPTHLRRGGPVTFYARLTIQQPDSAAVARIGFDALWRIGMSACACTQRSFAYAASRPLLTGGGEAARHRDRRCGRLAHGGSGLSTWPVCSTTGKLLTHKAEHPGTPSECPHLSLLPEDRRRGSRQHGVPAAAAWKKPEVAADRLLHHDPGPAPPEYLETPARCGGSAIGNTHTAALESDSRPAGGLMALRSTWAGRSSTCLNRTKGARRSSTASRPRQTRSVQTRRPGEGRQGELVPGLDGLVRGGGADHAARRGGAEGRSFSSPGADASGSGSGQ